MLGHCKRLIKVISKCNRVTVAALLYGIATLPAHADWINSERHDSINGKIFHIGMLLESNFELSVTCGKPENDISIALKFPKYLTFDNQAAEMIFTFDTEKSLNANKSIITDDEIAVTIVTADSLIISELIKADKISIKVRTTLGRSIGEKSYVNTKNSENLKSIVEKCAGG